jgi:phosphatidylserine/phosphatidylglycerophosphate/cardiolipin synthase-like enzyme
MVANDGKRGQAWTPGKFWLALRHKDREALAATLGCSTANVHKQVRRFRRSSPGGRGTRVVLNRDNHRLMGRMMDAARFEVLAAVAFISPSPPPVFRRLLGAASKGVDVKLLFRADNLTTALIASLREAGVEFRTATGLHAKFLITDTTAVNGSANFTEASASRATEVGVFVDDESVVHDLRAVFYKLWAKAKA